MPAVTTPTHQSIINFQKQNLYEFVKEIHLNISYEKIILYC